MRFLAPDGSAVHLSYCSNVHPAEDLDGVIAQLGRFVGPLRRELDVDRLGVGLWLSVQAVHELVEDRSGLRRLKAELSAQGAEVTTLNGFPYRGFHDRVVKHAVYRPDWSDPERLSHTLALARLLGRLLPDDAEAGSVSTLPLAWRDRWDDAAARSGLAALGRLAEGLADLADETGRPVRVGLEPEPGCIVETVGQAAEVLAGIDPRWVGLCLDACHLAVQFEEPAGAVDRLGSVGVPVVKAQLSSALRTSARAPWLPDFVEPRFLHQTRERTAGGVVGVDDLDEALAGGLPGDTEWRVHYHVPVHVAECTTQDELRRTMAALVGGPVPVTTHLEVETYTWRVLPAELRPVDDAGLVRGLAAELSWTRDQLTDLGLKEDT